MSLHIVPGNVLLYMTDYCSLSDCARLAVTCKDYSKKIPTVYGNHLNGLGDKLIKVDPKHQGVALKALNRNDIEILVSPTNAQNLNIHYKAPLIHYIFKSPETDQVNRAICNGISSKGCKM